MEAPTISIRRFSRCIKKMSFRRPKIVIGNGKEKAEVYATIDIEKARVGRTRLFKNEPNNPRWYESFHIYCAHMAADIIFTVKWANPIGATLIGRAYLPVKELLDNEEVDRWLEICDENKNPVGEAKIHVKVRYIDVSRDQNWSRGISGPNFPGVPNTFFGQRQSCGVTLYQDANRCWEDIFNAIANARRMIYIVGWSIYAPIALVRNPNRTNRGEPETLGELLKKKASQDIRVLILVWDDRTSPALGPLKRDGLMATHDQDTAAYFRDSSVHCVLCPRNPGQGESYVQELQTSYMFTHHQKTIVVDRPETMRASFRDSRRFGGFRHSQRWGEGRGESRVKIVSFLGGIDLCDGRYDTQQHSLFGTLNTVHRYDFHQPNFEGADIKKGGPREPWHDVHCRLEGPVAWDVLYNFEQRWVKQGDGKDLLVPLPTGISGPKVSFDDAIEAMSLPMEDTWNVQIFRSIDGGAAFGFPEKPEEAANLGLVTGKDHVIDRSIQDAYINAIRRAKNFIYIENQYFLGSSYDWKKDDIKVEDIGALHLIPKELSLKIVSKIEANEKFKVYIVVPMWPEGIPESASVQAILDWQRRTMEMMYADIVVPLQAKGIKNPNLKEYLTFFCLGNREKKNRGEYEPEDRPEPNTDYSRAQKSRRFMIYVHAKMMIVDDEYIIVGSANINQRSMDGGRDTEIAMGAYQPYHLATGGPPRGQIHTFRLSLWNEHLRIFNDAFLRPETDECIRLVNSTARKYWELYAKDSPDAIDYDLPGHLLSYPIEVTSEGEVKNLDKMVFFPDTTARVLGTKSDYLPPILTT